MTSVSELPPNFWIQLEEYTRELVYLQERDATLTALEAAGVDNWEGYEVAMQILNGDLDPEDL